MVAQSLNGALEEIELDGDNCHYQKIMMMESLREIEKWFLKFNDIFYGKNSGLPTNAAGQKFCRK